MLLRLPSGPLLLTLLTLGGTIQIAALPLATIESTLMRQLPQGVLGCHMHHGFQFIGESIPLGPWSPAWPRCPEAYRGGKSRYRGKPTAPTHRNEPACPGCNRLRDGSSWFDRVRWTICGTRSDPLLCPRPL